ncbi:protoporphyrinogen oxidase, partial [Myxococcota bacterium]|nr:protoporphyrinogen oxidase [Myxococcota bacterium]
MTNRERTAVIVGAGISGLAVAEAVERLSKEKGAPVKAVVLEAEREAGGKIKSSREKGFVVETGPHGFLDKEPAVFALVERLGLTRALVKANEAAARRWIVRAGKLREVPSKPPKFITSDILPFGAKLRVAMEPFGKARPEGVDESVWDFAARRIGPTAADVLVDAMVTGIYGGDPKRLSLASAFPRMFELESKYGGLVKAMMAIAKEKKAQGKKADAPAGAPTGTLYSFEEGLGTLTGALAKRANLVTGFEAKRLERAGAAWRVSGGASPVEGDAVVLTIPAFESAGLLAPFAGTEATLLGEVPYANVAVVVQAFQKADVGGADVDGFGFLAPHLEGRKILGSIFAHAVFPAHAPDGTVMMRSILGGRRGGELLDADDDGLLAMARAELGALVGIDAGAEPVMERVIRWPRGIPQYELGHAERVAAADGLESKLPGVFLSGNAFRGVAMIACIVDAERVAARVVDHVLRG